MGAREWLLLIASVAPTALVKALEWIKENAPDFAAVIDDLLLKIREGLAPEHIADAIVALPGELQNIILGRLDPRKHPGTRF